jgi:hypothetical protein
MDTGRTNQPKTQLPKRENAETIVGDRSGYKRFFDNIPHDLLMKAVRKHCQTKWMLLYIERWLVAPFNWKMVR